MKKLFILLTVVFSALNANAQFYVGGTTGLNIGSVKSSNDKTYTSLTFSLVPEIGYHFTESFSLGCGVGGSIMKRGEGNVKELSLNPYLRYEFNPKDKIRPIIDLGYSYSKIETLNDEKVDRSKISLLYGMSIYETDNLRFILQSEILSYAINNKPIDNVKKEFNINIIPNSFKIGIQYNF